MLEILLCPQSELAHYCEQAGMQQTDNMRCYTAMERGKITGFCLFETSQDTVWIRYAQAQEIELLDGLIRASIAKGQDDGAVFYAFDVHFGGVGSTELARLGYTDPKGDKCEIDKLFGKCQHG